MNKNEEFFNNKIRKKILIIATTLETLRVFKARYINNLKKTYEVTLIAAPQTSVSNDWLESGVHLCEMPISRKVSLLRDCLTLWSLLMFVKKGNFDVVYTITPKAGLLGQLSAFCFRVPVRIHTFTGQVWATKIGLSRKFFKMVDKLIGKLTTVSLVDGHAQRKFLVAERVCILQKTAVIMNGSVSGVNLEVFRPSTQHRFSVRSALRIAESDFVLLFVGRVVREKGFLDLLRAFEISKNQSSSIKLLIVGEDEESLIHNGILNQFDPAALVYIGHTEQPQIYMMASDVLCLPSYREGFGAVVLEAAACGIPSIVSDIYGLEDSIEPGITGTRHPVKNSDALANEIMIFEKHRNIVKKMGKAARLRVQKDFNELDIVNEKIRFVTDQVSKINC